MTEKSITQKVIDFQFMRMKIKVKNHIDSLEDSNDMRCRYSPWELQKILESIGVASKQYSTIWIGNDKSSAIYSFMYCLLQGCIVTDNENSMNFIKLKHALYELAAVYLSIEDQKMMVEQLSFAQYTKDLGKFLNRYSKLEQLVQAIFHHYIQAMKSDNALEQLSAFSSQFPFLKYSLIADNSASIALFNKTFYIVKEKQCCFVVEGNESCLQAKKNNESFLQTKKNSPNKKNNGQFQGKQGREHAEALNSVVDSKQRSTPKFVLEREKREKPRFSKIEAVQNVVVKEFKDNQSGLISPQPQEIKQVLKINLPEIPSRATLFDRTHLNGNEKMKKQHVSNLQLNGGVRRGFPYQSLDTNSNTEIGLRNQRSVSAIRSGYLNSTLGKIQAKVHKPASPNLLPLSPKIYSKVYFTYISK